MAVDRDPQRQSVVVVEGGHGAAVAVRTGDHVSVINTHGGQVVDTWALRPDGSYLSTAHSHTATGRLVPTVGDTLVDQHRRPMLRLIDDTSPGHHDTLLACCDPQRYRDLGVTGEHRTCRDNFGVAIADFIDLAGTPVPDPVNLFQHVAVGDDFTLQLRRATAAAGDAVTFEVLYDLVLVVSACPMDVVDVNAPGRAPQDVAVQVVRGR